MGKGNNLVIVTGIPGVGKTTVITTAVDMVRKKHNETVLVLNFGTAMFEVASRKGLVKDRDEMRKLQSKTQREVQKLAGKSIAQKARSARVIVDTHTLIQTGNGYLIGLPEWVVTALEPETIVLVEAEPDKIAARRSEDPTRTRDSQDVGDIEVHQQMCRAAAVAAGTLTGATVRVIKNRQGEVETAAAELYQTLME